jgi:hypothetical protein
VPTVAIIFDGKIRWGPSDFLPVLIEKYHVGSQDGQVQGGEVNVLPRPEIKFTKILICNLYLAVVN